MIPKGAQHLRESPDISVKPLAVVLQYINVYTCLHTHNYIHIDAQLIHISASSIEIVYLRICEQSSGSVSIYSAGKL